MENAKVILDKKYPVERPKCGRIFYVLKLTKLIFIAD